MSAIFVVIAFAANFVVFVSNLIGKMKCFVPEISWHNRDPVYSVDFQPVRGKNEEFYRLASGGADCHVVVGLGCGFCFYFITWGIFFRSGMWGWWLMRMRISLRRLNALLICKGIRNVWTWCGSRRVGNFSRLAMMTVILFCGRCGKMLIRLSCLGVIARRIRSRGFRGKCWEDICRMFMILRGLLIRCFWFLGLLITLRLCGTWWKVGILIFFNFLKFSDFFVFSEKSLGFLGEHKGFVQGVAWDPKGKFIATLSGDRNLRVFETAKRKQVAKCYKSQLPSSLNKGKSKCWLFYANGLKLKMKS